MHSEVSHLPASESMAVVLLPNAITKYFAQIFSCKTVTSDNLLEEIWDEAPC